MPAHSARSLSLAHSTSQCAQPGSEETRLDASDATPAMKSKRQSVQPATLT